jgi:bifunctional UDP-N-acetylglucosamine pyrophosphorylase / glucosamine-1-phosphate N-acetyltransferase
MIEIVILAAGKGTRMRSDIPKVMHTLAGKPLLAHVIDAALQLSPKQIHLVLGHGADQIKNHFADETYNCVIQAQQLGTGHAVQQALPHLQDSSTVLILYGDVPLINPQTLTSLLALVTDSRMGLLTIKMRDPQGYGRIVRDDSGKIVAIVEQKDANAEQLKIKEINTGVMAIKAALLQKLLPQLKNNNAQREYYLTDIIALANQQGYEVEPLMTQSEIEVQGINTRAQQAQLERQFQLRQADALMAEGTTLMDPARFDCRGSVKAGNDCVIDINCVFEGEVVLGNRVTIGPNCLIKNTHIGDDTVIHANSVIEDAKIAKDCAIGPFARVRPGSDFAEGAKVGNFVETKQTKVGKHSKINHLSYVGDAVLGDNVNIGAGTITCNYDGANKFKTTIADNVFIGSNSALVAPVTIAAGATVAAGSTVTQDVREGQLAVARQRQRNIDHWVRPTKK